MGLREIRSISHP